MPLLSLPPSHREIALKAVLELPERIELLSWREVAPMMASQLDGPGHGLNLLSREALAVATLLEAKVIMAVGNENHLLRTALEGVGLTRQLHPTASPGRFGPGITDHSFNATTGRSPNSEPDRADSVFQVTYLKRAEGRLSIHSSTARS